MEMLNELNEEKEFHAVNYMWEVRSKLTERYLKDKQNYLSYVKEAMEEFKSRQKKAVTKCCN